MPVKKAIPPPKSEKDPIQELEIRLAGLKAERDKQVALVRIEANMMVARAETEYASRIDELSLVLSMIRKPDEPQPSQDSAGDDSTGHDS